MKRYLPIVAVFSIVSFVSCSKNKDKTPPVIIFQSPAAINNFVGVSSVPVDVRISDNELISEVNYSLRMVDDYQFVFYNLNETVQPSKPEYSINYTFSVSTRLKMVYKFTVIAYDKAGNRAAEERTININQ